MNPKKPDRFERIVRRITGSDEAGCTEICFPGDVVKLLRREHRGMVRVIEESQRNARDMVSTYAINTAGHECALSRWELCNYLLSHLKRRAR